MCVCPYLQRYKIEHLLIIHIHHSNEVETLGKLVLNGFDVVYVENELNEGGNQALLIFFK